MIRKTLIAGILAIAALASAGCTTTDWTPRAIPKDPNAQNTHYVWRGGRDGTPTDFRDRVWKQTGLRLGECLKREIRSNFNNNPMSNGLSRNACVSWRVIEGTKVGTPGDVYSLPPAKPGLFEYLAASQ